MNHGVEPVGPRWWQFVWAVLFAMVVAAGFTIVGFAMFAAARARGYPAISRWYAANGHELNLKAR